VTRKHPLAECEVCPLQNARCAPTHGPQDAKIVIVSRSPGKADVLNGKPMSSTSGKILQSLLVDNGYDRKQVKVTNVVLCRCDEVPGAAIECCRPRLEADLESAETIIAAGR
jgi:uracil-DNA glycosylase family 4